MNAQEIRAGIGNILTALEREGRSMPRFTKESELAAWKAESQAIEKAAQASAAELIGETLLAFQNIANSLQVIAQAQTQSAKRPLLDSRKPGMPRLDE